MPRNCSGNNTDILSNYWILKIESFNVSVYGRISNLVSGLVSRITKELTSIHISDWLPDTFQIYIFWLYKKNHYLAWLDVRHIFPIKKCVKIIAINKILTLLSNVVDLDRYRTLWRIISMINWGNSFLCNLHCFIYHDHKNCTKNIRIFFCSFLSSCVIDNMIIRL